MQRIGIYGGTFNPPHLGHLRAAAYGVKALELTRLLMIPSCVSPHKQHLPEGSATARQRLEMLKIALKGEENIRVSDLELNRGGESYTWETVQQLKKIYPMAELILFMGTDMFLSFDSWKKPEVIMENASIGVFYRGLPGEMENIVAQKIRLESQGAKVYLIHNPLTVISSTDLRRLLVFQCADSFLPEGVGDYIRENHLYGTGRSYRQLPMEELEKTVVGLLKPSRVAHVLGCRDTARQLAEIWGADPVDAARAGLLHDITKALDGPLQLTLCQGYGTMLDAFSQENPKTLHALTGSLVAERIFGENPAVVRAIHHIIRTFARQGVKLSVCGEAGSDLHFLPLMLGMGLRYVSVSRSMADRVRYTVLHTDLAAQAARLEQVLQLQTEPEIRAALCGGKEDA